MADDQSPPPLPPNVDFGQVAAGSGSAPAAAAPSAAPVDPGPDSQNPFMQNQAAPIDPGPDSDNPFMQGDIGGTGDFGHGLKHAAVSLESMVGQTGEFVGHAIHAAGAASNSDGLQAFGEAIAQHSALLTQSAQAADNLGNEQSYQGQNGGLIRRNMYGTGDMLGQMGLAASSGAAIGLAAGAVTGPGAAITAGVGAGLAALAVLFGGSQGEQTLQKVQASDLQAGASPQAAEDTGLGAGAITGSIATLGGAVLNKIGPLGGSILEPIIGSVEKAAVGNIVEAALKPTLGTLAKGTALAAVEGAGVNTAIQAGIQGTEAGYGVGNGPTTSGLIDAAVQGGAISSLAHAPGATLNNLTDGARNNVLTDPDADPNARANAALGAAAAIATKDPAVAQDFGVYATNQIMAGLPIEVGPDAMYQGFAQALRQQQTDAATQAQQAATRSTLGQFPSFTPTGDEAAANAPDYVTDPNVAPPTAAAPISSALPDGDPLRVSQAQFPSFVPTGDEIAPTAPARITDVIGGIMGAGNIDDAINATEQSINGPIQETGQNAAATHDQLLAEQAHYAAQAAQAQVALRQQAFDQVQATATPPVVPTDAFAQRQVQTAAADDAARNQGFDQADRAQLAEQADQAPAVTAAAGIDQPQPSTLSGAMGAELTRLGNRNLNNLTTTQLGALAAHHPEPAIAQQAGEILAGRRNAPIVPAPEPATPAGNNAYTFTGKNGETYRITHDPDTQDVKAFDSNGKQVGYLEPAPLSNYQFSAENGAQAAAMHVDADQRRNGINTALNAVAARHVPGFTKEANAFTPDGQAWFDGAGNRTVDLRPEFSTERAALGQSIGFTTAKGSTYVVHDDGTTTRDKAFRPEHGAAEVGAQPRSESTFYVTPKQADALSLFQTQGGGKRIGRLQDGTVGVQYTDGPDAGKFERRTVVTPSETPATGLMPVETWKNGSTVHFGNAITKVDAQERTSSTQEPLAAEQAAKVNPGVEAAAPEGRALADTASELKPLKAAMDADAQARGQQNSKAGFVPVDTATLPDVRTAADNGVEGATTLSKSDAGLLQKSAAIFGKKVVLFRQEGAETGNSLDGAVLPKDPKTIYVNADASGAHHLVVVGHELAHQMQTEAPKLYAGMQKSLTAQLAKGGDNEFYRYYMNKPGMTDEDAQKALADPAVQARMTNEFIADLTGNRFGEYKTWQQVFADTGAGDNANKSMVYRIADFITSFIGKLLGNTKFKAFATDDMVNNLAAVRQSVRRALSEYAVQAGSKPMAHEAEQLRAAQANRLDGAQPKSLVEPVRAEPRADVGKEPSTAAPAPVADRLAEPTQSSRSLEASGTARTDRALESPERVNIPESPENPNERNSVEGTAEKGPGENAGGTAEGIAAAAARGDAGVGSPAVREDGRIGLIHYSRQAGLTEIDPAQHGSGMRGAESKRKAQDPNNFVNRSYYGLDVGKEGGYKKESGLGQHEYKTSLPADKLYDLDRDPDHLYPANPPADANPVNLYEKAIQDAGYSGYHTDHPQLGRVAAVFDKLKPEAEDGNVKASPERVNIPASQEKVDERQGIAGSAGPDGEQAISTASAQSERLQQSGVVRGSASWLAEQSRAHQGDDLAGLPSKVDVPGIGPVEFHSFKPAQDAARDYAKAAGLDYDPPSTYVKVDPERATRIAQEFDRMKDDPTNPRVAASYDAMVKETQAQYEALLKTGLKVEFIKPGQDDPYELSPRLAILDVVNNNHMWVFSTKEGYGDNRMDPANPMIGETEHMISGQPALANDLFRVVHDYFGHVKEGNGFRADGEENAWRSHMAMYSDVAREAATSETRGQNSWVNYGPYAESNRTASGEDTHFADQKIGLMPDWTSQEGRTDAPDATRLGDDLDPAAANPLSDDPAVRASGERALFLGKMSKDQEDAARSVGAITTPQTYKARMDAMKKDLGKKLLQGIADQFAPIRDISEKAYMEARMSKGTDGALEALMLYGKPFLRDGVYDVDVHDQGFAKTMASLDGEHGRFFLWVAAQRAEQLKAQGKENLFTDTDISALKTLNQSDSQHPMRQQKFDQALKDYNGFNDSVLKIAEQSGLLDADTRALFKDQPYVPFYRVMDDGDGMKGPGMKSGLVNQYAFKKLKGGSNQLNQDLLANTLANWGHLLGAASRNRAAVSTMDAAEKIGVADKVSAAEADKGSFKVMVKGQPQFYEVSDPHLLAAVSAMASQVPKWMRPLAEFKRLLTTGTTLAPGFRVRNLIRDTLTVLASSDIKMNPVGNIVEGFKSMDHHSQTFASMLASGGIIQFGTMLEGNEAARAHRLIRSGVDSATILNNEGAVSAMWGKAKEAADWYHEVGNKFENANRGALYQQLTAKGMGHMEASFQARDLMDFSLQGQNPVVRFLTTSVPFLNARIQGAYKIGRAVGEHPARAATVMGAVAMASLGLMLAYKDDPDWKQRPDWDRDNYWWFKMGGTAYRIPKPFEVGAIGTLAERTWEKAVDPEMTNARYVGEIRDLLFNQFNLNPTPQIVRPLLNVYANKDDFTGNQIENSSLQSLQPEDRYTPYTSMTSRFLGSLGLPDPAQLMLGRYSKLSPVQMDSLVNGYFGWLGTTTLAAVDAVTRPLSDNGARPALTMKDYSMGFAENLPANSSRYSDTMYQNLDNINQAYASWRMALNTGQFAKAQDVMNTDRFLGPSNKSLIQEHGMATTTAAMAAKLGLQERRVLDSSSLSADTKRAMLNRINQQRNQLAETASSNELNLQQHD